MAPDYNHLQTDSSFKKFVEVDVLGVFQDGPLGPKGPVTCPHLSLNLDF